MFNSNDYYGVRFRNSAKYGVRNTRIINGEKEGDNFYVKAGGQEFGEVKFYKLFWSNQDLFLKYKDLFGDNEIITVASIGAKEVPRLVRIKTKKKYFSFPSQNFVRRKVKFGTTINFKEIGPLRSASWGLSIQRDGKVVEGFKPSIYMEKLVEDGVSVVFDGYENHLYYASLRKNGGTQLSVIEHKPSGEL